MITARSSYAQDLAYIRSLPAGQRRAAEAEFSRKWGASIAVPKPGGKTFGTSESTFTPPKSQGFDFGGAVTNIIPGLSIAQELGRGVGRDISRVVQDPSQAYEDFLKGGGLVGATGRGLDFWYDKYKSNLADPVMELGGVGLELLTGNQPKKQAGATAPGLSAEALAQIIQQGLGGGQLAAPAVSTGPETLADISLGPGLGRTFLGGDLELPQESVAPATDFSVVREFLQQAEPTAPTYDPTDNILLGLATGLARAASGSGNIGETLASLGAGAFGGVASARQEHKGDLKEYNKALRAFNANMAEAEIAFAQADSQHAQKVLDTGFRNAQRAMQLRLELDKAAQPGNFSMTANGVMRYTYTDPSGNLKVKVVDTGVIDRLLEHKILLKSLGAKDDVIDFGSAKLALDRSDPVEAMMLIAADLDQKGLLQSALGEERYKAAFESAVEGYNETVAGAGLTPSGNVDVKMQRQMLYQIIAAFWLQPGNEKALERALGVWPRTSVKVGEARGRSQ